MQRLSLLAALAAWLLVSGQATSPEEVDTSVSSAIADTMAAIEGRARESRELERPAPMPMPMMTHKLGLPTLKERHHFSVKKLVLPKVEAPKQLAGYLDWSSKAKASFSTSWNTTGENAAKSVYVRDLEGNNPKQVAKKEPQALVADHVSTAYTRKLEDDMDGADFPSLDLDWGTKAKAPKAAPKMSLAKAESSETRSNSYLDAVGWKASATVINPNDNPYLQDFQDSNKKFLAATEVSEKKEKRSYFDDLVPDAASEVAVSPFQ